MTAAMVLSVDGAALETAPCTIGEQAFREAAAKLGRVMGPLAGLAVGHLRAHGWTEARIDARGDGSPSARRRGRRELHKPG
jgi:hypothetical protein